MKQQQQQQQQQQQDDYGKAPSQAAAAKLTLSVPFADKPTILQTLGIIAMLGLLGLTSYQVTISLEEYLEFPTVVTVAASTAATFPEITICNVVPLSFTSALSRMNLFDRQVGMFLANVTQLNGGIPPTTLDTQTLAQSVDIVHFKRSLGIELQTLILNCEFDDQQDCLKTEYFTQEDHIEYLNCYKFHPNVTFKAVTFVLFSESLIGASDFSQLLPKEQTFPLSAYNINGDLQYDKSSGVALYLKHREIYPHSSNRIIVSSGQSSIISFTQNSRTTLNQTKAPCAPNKLIEYRQLNGENYSPKWEQYQELKEDCIMRSMSDKLQELCNCRDTSRPVDRARANLSLCLDVNSANYSITAACYKKNKRRLANLVNTQHCLDPCEIGYYSAQVTGSKWPLANNIQSIVEKLVIPKRLELEANGSDIMHGLRYIEKLDKLIGIDPAQLNRPSKMNGLKSTDRNLSVDSINMNTNATRNSLLQNLVAIISSNFLKVQIRPESDTIMEVSESYKMQFTNLLSECGGLLGLYLGWSALSVIEFIHFLVSIYRYLVFGVCKKQQRRTAGNKSVTKVQPMQHHSATTLRSLDMTA